MWTHTFLRAMLLLNISIYTTGLNSPIARLRSVSKAYDINIFSKGFLPPGSRPETALVNVSLEIEKGTIYSSCGISGSGKSTLLGIIAGTLAPTEGEANVTSCVPFLVGDEVLKRMKGQIAAAGSLKRALSNMPGLPADGEIVVSKASCLNLVAEHTSSWNDMSEGARVAASLVLAIANCSPSVAAADKRLSMLRCHSAHGGAVQQPPLLLLDELLDGIGPSAWATREHRAAANAVLRRAAKSIGLSCIYATHSMEHAAAADLVITFSAGQIKEVATPSSSTYLQLKRRSRR